jgi:hypothetical protein
VSLAAYVFTKIAVSLYAAAIIFDVIIGATLDVA